MGIYQIILVPNPFKCQWPVNCLFS